MTSFWDQALAGREIPPVPCQHCYRGLWARPATGGTVVWEDIDGGTVCIMIPPADDGGVQHKPLPAGLRGAPADLT